MMQDAVLLSGTDFDQRLRSLAAQKMSSPEIATVLSRETGTVVKSKRIYDRMRALGLPYVKRGDADDRERRSGHMVARNQPGIKAKPLSPSILAAFASQSDRGLPIGQLGSPELHLQCRWPFSCDDGSTRYCGEQSVGGGSWCQEHHSRVFAVRARVAA